MTTKTIKELEKEALELYIEATKLYIAAFPSSGGVQTLDSNPGVPPNPPPPPPGGGH